MRIVKTVTVTVDASADDWELYDRPGREDAAIALNGRFMELVNQGYKRGEVETGMWPKLREYSELGAIDTEGVDFLELLLDKTFGSPG